jgi:hypothetical protein
MARAEQRPARTISWSDLAIGIFFTWLGEKVLDFILRKVEARAKFEGETHFGLYVMKVLYGLIEMSDLTTINAIVHIQETMPLSSDEVMFKEHRLNLKASLIIHRKRHLYGFIKDEPCRICSLINANKRILQHFVTDAKYYPPFSRGSIEDDWMFHSVARSKM